MNKRIVLLSLLVMLVFSCKNERQLNAKTIIDKSIEISGGAFIKKATIDFGFRGRHYSAIRNNGVFKFVREFIKGTDTITDLLSNDTFKRTVNRQLIQVSDSMIPRYSASINSVHYFSVLPYGLNDDAVIKTYLKKVIIKGSSYYKIKITFAQEGGGEDFEDVFMYFVNVDTFKVDYLAYSYNEDDGIGLRFREAYNERYVNRIRFVDYNNYKPINKTETLENMEVLFENNGLELLSKIELENISVNLD